MLACRADFLVKRNADWIDDRIRQVVDQLDRAAVVMKSVVAVMTPVERINPELEAIGYSNFELFANEYVIPIRAVAPCDRVFQLNAARRRRRRFVQEGEVTDAAESAHRRQDRQ